MFVAHYGAQASIETARPMLTCNVSPSCDGGQKGGAVTTSSHFMRRLMLAAGAVVVLALPATAGRVQTVEPSDREAALQRFHDRVEDYAVLHRRLERALPPLKTTRHILENYIAQQLLADALRKARRQAQQGDIFSPEIASAFRGLISEALKGRDVEAFVRELQWEHPDIYDIRPVVNQSLPDEATHEMPSVLLQAFPSLPEDVEYRIVNHDLVLWDIHANLVIDYVPRAFRPFETTLLR